MSQNSSLTFEQAFSRLEEILEKMNSSALALDESIRLYEEADSLIHLCQQRLGQAETKIEMLVKNREGDLQMSAGGIPSTQPFSSSSHLLQG
jgi:exodeoxyribonuclease VII small subunit